MPVLQLSEKGQILIPKPLRNKLGFKPHGKVQITEEDGRIIIVPVPDDPIAAATGFLKGAYSLTRDLQREHREEARRDPKTRPR